MYSDSAHSNFKMNLGENSKTIAAADFAAFLRE